MLILYLYLIIVAAFALLFDTIIKRIYISYKLIVMTVILIYLFMFILDQIVLPSNREYFVNQWYFVSGSSRRHKYYESIFLPFFFLGAVGFPLVYSIKFTFEKIIFKRNNRKH